jgi:hypothetical protein
MIHLSKGDATDLTCFQKDNGFDISHSRKLAPKEQLSRFRREGWLESHFQ